MNPIYVKLNHLTRLLAELERTPQLQTSDLLGELNARLYDLNFIIENQFQNYIPPQLPQYNLQPELPRYHRNSQRYTRRPVRQIPLNSHPPTSRYWSGPIPTNRPQFIRNQYYPHTHIHTQRPSAREISSLMIDQMGIMDDLPGTFTNMLSQIMGLNIEEELDQLQQQLENQESVPVPLTDEYLKRIPVKRWKRKKKRTNDSNSGETEEETCVICFDPFKRNQHVRNLPCEHTFHRKCIDRWFSEKTTCPICRGDMRDLLQQQQSQRPVQITV